LIDPGLIDEGIEYFLAHQDFDYIKYRNGLPIGMAVEIFKFSALEKSYLEAADPECREHVTPYIYRNPGLFHFCVKETEGSDYSNLRWTVDTEADYKLIRAVYESLFPDHSSFGFMDIIEAYQKHPEWKNINASVVQKQVSYQGK
jgi:spore coat polysaccharide biosynthesis protein SpsF